MAESIIGSWYVANPGGGTDQIVFSFLSNGHFLVADMGSHDRDPSGQSGLEEGTYSWNAATGAISFNFTVNTDGAWGLSNSGVTSATVAGNTLTFTGAEGSFAVPRLTSLPGSIVGSWEFSQPAAFPIVFTFLADGHYMMSDGADPAHDPHGTPGIEWGTYTWNANTGALTVTTLVNTDGQWGFSDSHGEAIVVHVVGDTLTLGGISATRLSPVPMLTGTSGDDLLFGPVANNTFTGLDGNDTIAGMGGIDTANYSGAHANYSISKTPTGWVVQDNVGSDGRDTLTNVERLHFSDVNVALDISGSAGFVDKLLNAIFGAGLSQADHKAYMGIGLFLLDIGLSQAQVAQKALNAILPGETNTDLVNLLYTHVVGHLPPADELDYFLGLLGSGLSQAGLVVTASNSPLSAPVLVGVAETGIDYAPFG